MEKLASNESKRNPPKICNCPVHREISHARACLHEMGFDPHTGRGLFVAEFSVLLARLDSGLPIARESLESLLIIAKLPLCAEAVPR